MKRCYFILSTIALLWVIVSCNNKAESKLILADIFTDNIVLQQEQDVPIWGLATPESEIEVKFREQSVKTAADKEGKWKLNLKSLKIGEPDSLVVTSGSQKIVLKNVLVGDVWICSGQSNMEMNVGCTWAKVNNSEKEIANANFPNLRLFIVDRNTSFKAIDTLTSKGWLVCSPETVGEFSAVGYFFGRDIHQEQNIPIGLIQTAWGGTVAEAWTSLESIKLLEDFAGQAKEIESLPLNKDSLIQKYKRDSVLWLLEAAKADIGIKDGDTLFAKTDIDESDWMEIEVPGMVEKTSIGAVDGVIWFRKKVDIPKNQLGKDLTITIAPPDDYDETYFNGVKIGESKVWDVVRKYTIPANLVKEKDNQIVVRLTDNVGDGGFMGKKEDFSIYSADGWRMNIQGPWLCKLGFDKQTIKTSPLVPGDPNNPTVLYNAMIKPLLPYSIKGAIWYQGESNSGRAYQYQTLFPTMIKDWRKNWGQGDFPFYFVQLANYQKRNTEPIEDSWAELREAQTMALKLPNTGMAVTIDIGDGNDIHPANKQDVGKRLALIAKKHIYKKDIPYSGPIYKSMKIEGNKVILDFDFVYEGLQTSDNKKPIGFAIAGDDKKFVWANAEIVDNQIIVSSAKVQNPVAVRYAWSSNPECNLINSAKLPASPFRTDSWKISTQK